MTEPRQKPRTTSVTHHYPATASFRVVSFGTDEAFGVLDIDQTIKLMLTHEAEKDNIPFLNQLWVAVEAALNYYTSRTENGDS